MAARIRFQLSKHGEGIGESSDIANASSSALSGETLREIIGNLHTAYDIFRVEEKNLTKKERLSFFYYHFALVYNLTHSLLHSNYCQVQLPSPIQTHSEEILQLFRIYFPISLSKSHHQQHQHHRYFQINLESLCGKDIASSLLSHNIRWNEEDCLWFLFCFSIRQMLEIRKKDCYHFQTQYRLAMMLHNLVELKPFFPHWIMNSFLPIKPLSNELNALSSAIDPTLEVAGKSLWSETVDMESREMEIPDLTQNEVSSSYPEGLKEVEMDVDIEVPIAEAEVEDNNGEHEEDAENEEGGSFEIEVEDENQTEENLVMQSADENMPEATTAPDIVNIPASNVLRLHNSLLINFLENISHAQAFKEMHKLFERRYPQIIAMWHDQIPDNPWEKVSRYNSL